jgi:DNA invertase Pin-like site-specific DNA recombinase
VTPAALYLRVSTDDLDPKTGRPRQTVENQRADLYRLASARGWSVVEFTDEGVSGSKMRRPGLDRMREAARRGEVRVVAVWALDRLGRSMAGVVDLVLELDRLGVQVVSVKESWLDTAGPVRSLLVAIFGWVAELERAKNIERTRAGLDRARAQGVRLGRPKVSPLKLEAAALDYLAPVLGPGPVTGRRLPSLVAVARRHGVKPSTLRRYLATRTKNPTP